MLVDHRSNLERPRYYRDAFNLEDRIAARIGNRAELGFPHAGNDSTAMIIANSPQPGNDDRWNAVLMPAGMAMDMARAGS